MYDNNITCTFQIEEEIHEKLKKIADEEHRSLAGQIRLIIEKYLDETK